MQYKIVAVKIPLHLHVSTALTSTIAFMLLTQYFLYDCSTLDLPRLAYPGFSLISRAPNIDHLHTQVHNYGIAFVKFILSSLHFFGFTPYTSLDLLTWQLITCDRLNQRLSYSR